MLFEYVGWFSTVLGGFLGRWFGVLDRVLDVTLDIGWSVGCCVFNQYQNKDRCWALIG